MAEPQRRKAERETNGVLKVWWPNATLFFTLLVFLSYIQYIHSHILTPMNIRRGSSRSIIAEQLSGRHLPGVPSRDLNSGLPTASRCVRVPSLSHAAPSSEPRRTLIDPRRNL